MLTHYNTVPGCLSVLSGMALTDILEVCCTALEICLQSRPNNRLAHQGTHVDACLLAAPVLLDTSSSLEAYWSHGVNLHRAVSGD